MAGKSARPAPPDLRDLRIELGAADDRQIVRIAALLDSAPQLPVSDSLLTTLRGRLTSLRPARKLRFERLLFAPFGDLIVAPLAWRPGEPTIPRNAVVALSAAVRAALGTEVAAIDRMIAGHDTHATLIITRAGALLWARAGDLLATLPTPSEWTRHTGLPADLYGPLAGATAAVLRRAVALNRLLQDAEAGGMEPARQTVRDALHDLATEPPEGCVMVIRLLLGCLPDHAELSRLPAAAGVSRARQAMLRTALHRAMDDFLAGMDAGSALMARLRQGPLAAVSQEMPRLARRLCQIEAQPDTGRHRARLDSIRAALDGICRTRFSEGVHQRLIAQPADLAAVEECARHLHLLQATGRQLGGRVAYDALLQQASETLRDAAQCGRLEPGRTRRLLGILSGQE